METTRFMLKILILFIGIQVNAHAHEMQHGFILTNNDTVGSHLVATGHHSRQTEIVGRLVIQDSNERDFYQDRKEQSSINHTYFLFQAQQLDLPNLSVGKILDGYIIESKIGKYETKNKIVNSATFEVKKIILNIPNPFFSEDVENMSLRSTFGNDNYSDEPPLTFQEKRHCCDIPGKPCNWKC